MSTSASTAGNKVNISETGNRGVPGIDLPTEYDAQLSYVARNSVLEGNCFFLARRAVPANQRPQFDAEGVPFSDQYWAVLGAYGGGARGVQGQSNYEVAVAAGFEGTVDEWLATQVGATGQRGLPGGALTDEALAAFNAATAAAAALGATMTTVDGL